MCRLKEKNNKSTNINLKTPTPDLLDKDFKSMALNTFKKLKEKTKRECKQNKSYT